jgi:hypothetical protein
MQNYTSSVFKTVFLIILPHYIYDIFKFLTLAMPQLRWSVTSFSPWRLQSQGTFRIFGGQSGTRIGFPLGTSVVPCQYHSTAVPYSHMYHLGDT